MTVMGILSFESKPKSSAWSRIASPPSVTPRSANAVLHEMRIASARVCSPVGEQRAPPKFFMVWVEFAYGYSSGAGITVSGVY
ncbi:hypothetical protein D3C74_339290 [compost metagenome]